MLIEDVLIEELRTFCKVVVLERLGFNNVLKMHACWGKGTPQNFSCCWCCGYIKVWQSMYTQRVHFRWQSLLYLIGKKKIPWKNWNLQINLIPVWIPLCLTNWFKKNIMIQVGQDDYFLARARRIKGKQIFNVGDGHLN